jgi:O-antigen/teichoic acid export membrane protein
VLFNLSLSYIIIRNHEVRLWGEYVALNLVALAVTTITSWGNSEYLQRHFAAEPLRIKALWTSNFATRLLLLIPILLILAYIPFGAVHPLTLMLYVTALFVQRSFDVLISYQRQYWIAASIETVSFSALLVFAGVVRPLSLEHLVLAIGTTTILKAVFLSQSLRSFTLTKAALLPNMRILQESFPFFLPALVGFVQSRVDMFIVALSLSRAELAYYHVLLSILSLVHQASLTFINPYVRSIYRLGKTSVERFAKNFFILGLFVTVTLIPLLYLSLKYLYSFQVTLTHVLLAAAALPPLFYYSVKTYQWFKADRQYAVALINIVLALVTAGTAWALIPILGITGALLACGVAQWISLTIFSLKL